MLTSHREVVVEATHTLPRLPSWHVCARLHAHTFAITARIAAPRAAWGGDGEVFARAMAALEDRLRLAYLNDLAAGEVGAGEVRADEAWLAEYAHRHISANLPAALSDGLTVWVTHHDLRVPARFPPAAPGEKVEVPAADTPFTAA
jgi:6-pyruvoyltetrahydropterin/6-carboxytetrahydropterin synthase